MSARWAGAAILVACCTGVLHAQTSRASSGMFFNAGMGAGSSRDAAGAMISGAFVAKRSWFAVTGAPLGLIVSAERNSGVTIDASGRGLSECSDNPNRTSSDGSTCPTFSAHWFAIGDVAVRIPQTPIFVGVGAGLSHGYVNRLTSVTAYLGRSDKVPYTFRALIGPQMIGLEVGMTVRLK